MNWHALIACGLLGFGVVLLFVPVILKICRRARLRRTADLHHPHPSAVPRFGGLALAGALVAVEGFVAFCFPELRSPFPAREAVLVSSLAMFGLGFWDDLKPLGAKRKLAVQIIIALAVCLAGIDIEKFKLPFSGRIIALHGWGVPVTVLWLVGITNLLNLIDGVDGLATGIALMLMALLVYVGSQTGGFVLLTAGLTGAVLGFLCFNFPPARIYLGDGGAYFLGFQIAVLSIVGSQKGSIFAALIAPLFVLALPIVDTTLAILRRGLRGLPLFRPDRRHIHHRLLGMGLSRRQVVLSLYGLTLVFFAMGVAAMWSRGQLVPVLAGLVVLLLLLCAGKLSFSREWFAVGRTVGNSMAMREDVQYALCLTRWLRLEGRRCASPAELYHDFLCVAARLGFSSVRLTSPGGERYWREPCACSNTRYYRQELHGGPAGELELGGPACLAAHNCPRSANGSADGPAVACQDDNPARFEIMAELVTEAWAKSVAEASAATGPLRFGAGLPPGHRSRISSDRPSFPLRRPGGRRRETLHLENHSVPAS